MKTKISHLGRSTVSVILAVMMLLSTMLIGTVSTVNAVDLTKFSKVYLDANEAKYNSTDTMKNTLPKNAYAFNDINGGQSTYTEETSDTEVSSWPGGSLKSEGNGIYSILVSNDATKIIFNSGKGGKQTGNLILPPTWKTTPMIYRGSGTDGSNGWEEYTTSVKVADSVTLTANPTSVKVGKPVTLTPKVSGSKLDNLNYTYNKISGGAATEVKNADNSLTVTPTVAGTYKYTVTVSADGYSPVTSIEASFTVTDSVKYYIGGRFKGESWNPNRTDMQFVKVDGESNLYKYETNMTVSQLSQNVDNAKQYFFIYTGNGNEKVYYASSDRLGHTFHKNSINNQLTLKYYPTKADDEKNYIKFDDVADSSSNVVLYLDTSDKDNLKLYYSADIEPDYRITGNLSAIGEWNGYDSALKFDTAESDGSYSKVITVTDDDVNNKFFKLIKSENGSDKYYGPNDSTYDIISSNSSVTAYDTFEGSGEGNDFYFSKAGTYKIHYIVKTGKNTPSVWVEENTTKYNVTVAENIKSIASVDKTEAAKGEKVTVTATSIPQGQILNTVTVVGEDGSIPIETTVSGNTATFAMPNQNVTVTNVTFRTANKYTVKFSPNNSEYGDVSAKNGTTSIATDTKVTEGDTVTFTATANEGYTFTGWTVTVNGTSNTYTDSSLSLPITANTDVVANFGTGTLSTYYLLCGYDQNFKKDTYTPVPLYKNEAGGYYADFDAAGIKKQNYYIIFSTKEDTSGIIDSYTNNNNNKDVNVIESGENGFSFGNNYAPVSQISGDSYVKYAKVNIKSDSNVTGFTIKITDLDVDNKTITYSAEPKFKETPKNAVNIFAKNGTIATNGTQIYGVTKVTSGVIDPTGSEKAGYTKYMAVKGSIITVQTTVNEDYKKEGYYVYAYCVNGKTVPAQKTEPGVYSASYTIDGTNTDIEITPVYFNTNIEEAGDYITFYVNADELEGKWGDTVALYTYYYKSDEVNNNNAFSATAYPGQPMLQNKDGLFYIKVPKYYYDKGQKQYGYNKDAKKPYAVSGMTINNYGLEGLHKDLKGAKDADGTVANRQSYDYKDFAVLAEQGYDTIMFDVKYRKGTSNQSSLLNNEKDAPVITDPKIDILTYGNKTHNGWDDFINYFSGNKTDVLGYDLDPKQAKKLYVVSTGNQKTTVGVWSTEWYVFDQDGKFIVQGNPNDFILTDKDVAEDSTNKIWKALKNYKGAETKICYESEMTAATSHEEGNDGIRVDGRWYYTKADDVKVTLKTRVEYSTDHGTTFFKDENTNPENTGFIGKETGVKAAINDVTSCEFALNATNAVLTASSSSLWLFKGWYVYVKDADGNYNYIEYDKDAMSKIELVTGAYTEFVARYIKIGSGQLVLSHTAYDGPDKLGGRGTYYIQVDLTGKDGNTTTYDYTTGSITIPIAQSDQLISIKLKTVCAGNNTFYRFYEKDKNGKYLPFGGEGDSDVGKPGTVEHSFTVNPSDLFDSDGKQVTMALNYYSDISPVTGDAVLHYRYKNRFDQDRVYTVNVKLNDTYYDTVKKAYIIDPNNEVHQKLIMDNAPAIDDLHKDCLWSITQQTTTINGTNVVLDGIQTGKKFNVELSYYSDDVQTDDAQTDTDFALTYSGKLALNSYIKNSDTDDFYKTAAEVNGKKFLYWSVSVVSDNTKREIARCYSQYFNLRVTDNFIVTPVYGEKKDPFISIGNATYTREQYTEAGINYDYLYADFIVAFMSPNAELLNQSSKYKTGVIVELNQNAKVTEADVKNGGQFGAVGSTVNYSGIKFNSSPNEIQKLATGNSSSVKYAIAENVSNIAYKFEINNSGYNNKNRLDYYVKFKNTQAYRNYVMKAYYYVYEVDASGKAEAETFKITGEVYFNLYDIGNSETKK